MQGGDKKGFDSQLQAYFGTIKRTIKEDHVSYLKAHPQLRQILNDFISSCLLQQPDNVYEYGQKFFSYFNYQKDTLRYKPLVISGCSGVGKGTLIKMLIQRCPDLFELSISYTTRRSRQGQVHGREYYFVTKDQFQKQIQKQVFAEMCEVHQNFYGTHKGKLNDIINRSKICLLDIDLQGGQKIQKNFSECNFIFINPPSLQVLEQRLRKRGTEDLQVIEKRMINAKNELEKVKQLPFYTHLTNDILEKCFKQLIDLIQKKYSIEI